jgi:hypothetical protein
MTDPYFVENQPGVNPRMRWVWKTQPRIVRTLAETEVCCQATLSGHHEQRRKRFLFTKLPTEQGVGSVWTLPGYRRFGATWSTGLAVAFRKWRSTFVLDATHSRRIEKRLHAKSSTFTTALFKSVGFGARVNRCKLIFEFFVYVGFGQAVKGKFPGREFD